MRIQTAPDAAALHEVAARGGGILLTDRPTPPEGPLAPVLPDDVGAEQVIGASTPRRADAQVKPLVALLLARLSALLAT